MPDYHNRVTKVETGRIYRTTDGQVFTSDYAADQHQLKLNLMEFLQREGVCQGGEWTLDMVFKVMWDCKDELSYYFIKPD